MRSKTFAAYVVPFALFMGGLALVSVVGLIDKRPSIDPIYWIYPLQTVVCTTALIYFWRCYDFRAPKGSALGVVAGILALIVWLAPGFLPGAPPRIDGFNPTVFENDPMLYWLTVITRFLRLVVVVPFIEEIFWRGFLMRYLVKEEFDQVEFGTYRPFAFWATAIAFMLVHQPADWPAAAVTGVIYNYLAVKTRSLFACVLAHAITNLALGIFIMQTRQWGYW